MEWEATATRTTCMKALFPPVLSRRLTRLYLDVYKRQIEKFHAGVMELADVVDSKSTGGDTVPVRVRPPAYIEEHSYECSFLFNIKNLLYCNYDNKYKLSISILHINM